ncbi:hypothetical protein WKK_00100 [Weissella koreensis KACC 15510]|nr:hypothetical protein WKK_00100 [Weissella koreensis KACC 15510]
MAQLSQKNLKIPDWQMLIELNNIEILTIQTY